MLKTVKQIQFPSDRTILFFSPHDDDVVWSCGGIVASLIENGYCVFIIQLFNSHSFNFYNIKDLNISKWRLNTIQKAREVEHKNAMYILNSKYYILNNPEAAIRLNKEGHFIYKNFISLFNRIQPYDYILIDSIFKTLKQIVKKDDILIIPMGLGNHIDHQITSQIAKKFTDNQKYFYQEIPYNKTFQTRMSNRFHFDACLYPINDKLWIEASLCYQSQIQSLFEHSDTLIHLLKKNMVKISFQKQGGYLYELYL